MFNCTILLTHHYNDNVNLYQQMFVYWSEFYIHRSLYIYLPEIIFSRRRKKKVVLLKLRNAFHTVINLQQFSFLIPLLVPYITQLDYWLFNSLTLEIFKLFQFRIESMERLVWQCGHTCTDIFDFCHSYDSIK